MNYMVMLKMKNLNGLVYSTCTLLCNYFLIIMVIYIYKYEVNIVCLIIILKRLNMIEESILNL
jgi:hypothetical protein